MYTRMMYAWTDTCLVKANGLYFWRTIVSACHRFLCAACAYRIPISGQLEAQEATAKLQQLSTKIQSLKLQVHDVTVNTYSNFSSKLHSTEQLVSDVQGIKAEMDEMEDRIENKVNSLIY